MAFSLNPVICMSSQQWTTLKWSLCMHVLLQYKLPESDLDIEAPGWVIDTYSHSKYSASVGVLNKNERTCYMRIRV